MYSPNFRLILEVHFLLNNFIQLHPCTFFDLFKKIVWSYFKPQTLLDNSIFDDSIKYYHILIAPKKDFNNIQRKYGILVFVDFRHVALLKK